MASVVVLALAGCTSGSSSSHVRLAVSPSKALFDAPVTVTMKGLSAGEKITLSTASTARDGTVWSARTDATATKAGTLRSTSMAMFADEAPKGDPSLQQVFRPRDPWTITVSATSGGHRIATTSITRLLPSQGGVTDRPLRPATTGSLYGEYFAPRSVTTRHPAVVVIGGSEGGLSTTLSAAELAAHGYPALALAYFKEPGLPSTLSRIPIEYFARAVTWLAKQRGVDPHRTTIWGTSRGSEAALLTAAHFPSLVRGAVVTSPSDVVFPGLPDYHHTAWTLHGADLPFSSGFFGPQPHAALIPVRSVAGPIFAACGTSDQVWPSCDFVTSMQQQLAAGQSHYRPTIVRVAGAGHFVGDLTPYVPDTTTTIAGSGATAGGTAPADERGRAAGFVALLHWLATLPGS